MPRSGRISRALGWPSTFELSARERHVRDAARGADRLYFEAVLQSFESVPESYSSSQDNRCDHNVHVVDQICGEELTNSRRPSTDSHVELTCGLLGKGQCFDGRGIDKMEGRTAHHLDSRPRMVCQHEHRSVKHRIVTPPTFPIFIGPRAALGSELVAAHDFGTDAWGPIAGEGLV